jgi:anti-sigma regulatory factor (Ser/Thr protein kinase)
MFELLAERQFPAVVEAPAAARQFVASELLPYAPEVVETAMLATSELATNAVSHTASSFFVRVLIRTDAIRVEVVDQSSRPPALSPLSDGKVGGRGLHIIDAISGSWGVDQLPANTGKIVWFTLARCV